MAKATYTTGDDGLPVEKVGDWAISKLKILTDYIQASGAARRGYLRSGAAYIDVFSGPGRSLLRSTGRYIDGSPVAAFKKAQASLAPFTSVQVSDDKAALLAAAEKRLRLLQAPVEATPGPASSAIERIVSKLNPHGLHVAFLDPHNLGNLSFTLFESLARLKHIDLYTSEDAVQFNKFAPGWRDAVTTKMNKRSVREAILRHWSNKVSSIGLPPAKHCELITGHGNQRLYWLMFLSHHPFAHELWGKISSIAKAPTFSFDG
jgi:hypothetical protein